jgi:hypothetical protein
VRAGDSATAESAGHPVEVGHPVEQVTTLTLGGHVGGDKRAPVSAAAVLPAGSRSVT